MKSLRDRNIKNQQRCYRHHPSRGTFENHNRSYPFPFGTFKNHDRSYVPVWHFQKSRFGRPFRRPFKTGLASCQSFGNDIGAISKRRRIKNEFTRASHKKLRSARVETTSQTTDEWEKNDYSFVVRGFSRRANRSLSDVFSTE